MSATGLLTRIKIQHSQGAELAYIYEHELIDLLPKEKRPSEYEENFLNIGSTIIVDGKEYTIVNIHTKSFPKVIDGYQNYGINMYGVGEQLAYNFQITYTVE